MKSNVNDKIQIINNREKFLKLEKFLIPIHLTKILIIKNQKLDHEFRVQLFSLLKKEKNCLKELEIKDCQFINKNNSEDIFEYIYNMPLKNLSISNCNLKDEMLKDLFYNFDIYNILYVDLSYNFITEEKLFFEIYDYYLQFYFSSFTVNISNNPICKKISDKEHKYLIINK